MDIKKLKDMLAKKETRKSSLSQRAAASEDVAELRSINIELSELNDEISELRSLIAEAEATEDRGKNQEEPETRGQEAHEGDEFRSMPNGKFRPLGSFAYGDHNNEAQREKELNERYEERGAYLKEGRAVTFTVDEFPEFRAVTVGGGTLVTEKKYKPDLAPKFNEISSLIDVVNAVPLIGGESYTAGFEVSDGEGDYTLEDGNYADADPAFDYVTLNKAKITAYSEITDETKKLPNIDYQSRVAMSIGRALRKKITRQILVGSGGANSLTGIFNAPAKVIPTATDISIAAIDADTLDRIVFGYGGPEDVEGGAFLVLNKNDLAAFAAIRSTTGEKLYEITLDGNVGTISASRSYKVPFLLNSAAPQMSAAGTASGTHCMAYGFPAAYELPVFSQITVEESRDYKFKSGQIAYRGSVWAGGNVTMHKGFVRVKKS
ncbi:phage major capsid protein [Paenibacillus oleatilyticus]|uniref:phage major capsid protein n=1 Tax=Paenibacillus oleatilyticus TaxID=2594886 RepID=UPI001C1FDF0E|nr:phage major capsid protein [Paenibacillus oleatilyticus]MBU7320282.1 phage major capsid protein [Paenibacillus oleatilyticus]